MLEQYFFRDEVMGLNIFAEMMELKVSDEYEAFKDDLREKESRGSAVESTPVPHEQYLSSSSPCAHS